MSMDAFRYDVTFRLDPRPDPVSHDEERVWRREICRHLGLKIVSYAWCRLDLSTPAGLASLARVVESRDRRGLWVGSIDLTQRLSSEAEAAASHFLIGRGELGGSDWITAHDYDRVRNGKLERVALRYPSVAADRVPIHADVTDYVFVSERVAGVLREVAPELELLWLRDRGRFAAKQWYIALPAASAGRGLAHDWFEPSRLGPYSDTAATMLWRRAQPGRTGWDVRLDEWGDFRAGWFTSGAPPSELVEFLGGARQITVSGVARFAASRVPKTAVSRTHDGLLVSRGVRQALLEARVLTSADFEGARLVDEPDDPRVDLDALLGPVEPYFAADKLARMREESPRLRSAHDAKPKPARRINLKTLLSYLRGLRREGTDLSPGASAARLRDVEARMGRPLPETWKALLGVTAEGTIFVGDHDLVLWPLDALPEEHAHALADVAARVDGFAPPWLFVGAAISGDRYALVLPELTAVEDCAVVLVSHDTSHPEETWPSVGAFLHWLLVEG